MPSVGFSPARQASFSMVTAARGTAPRRALPEHDSWRREIVLKACLCWPRAVNIFTLATECCLGVLTHRLKDQS